jgi:hypothetical protein
MGLAKLCAAAGHRSKSQQHFDAAMGLYREMGMEFWVRQSARALELDGAHTR